MSPRRPRFRQAQKTINSLKRKNFLNVVQNALDPQKRQEEPVQEADSSTEDVVVETDTEELGELSEEDEEALKDFNSRH